jgi:hypothetical protein
LALKCIQKAQILKDLELEFDARMAYVYQVNFLNKHDLGIAMFPWFLKKCDEDPERFDYYQTLWVYKWIVNSVRDFAKVPLEKTESLLKDFEKRLLDYGTGKKVIHYVKVQYFDAIGELPKAAEEYKRYLKAATSGTMDDCIACQPNNMIDHLLSHGQYEEVFNVAQPILRGDKTCRTVPQTTYPKLILPALALGRREDAENFARLAKKNLPLTQANLRSAAHLVVYYTLKEDFTKGKTVIEKQFPYLLEHASEVDKFYFHLAAHLFFQKMQEKKKKSVKLSLPANPLLYAESGTYAVGELAAVFTRQLDEVTSQLDQRNGNAYYRNLIGKNVREVESLAAALAKE